jgi:N-acetylneuraminate synthase/N,N'-diacetyllegionaminate synthase
MKTVRVGDRVVGEGEPALLTAEAGINHNGDIKLAHQLVDAAANAGADAVKFQNYRTEDFVTDRTLTYKYVVQGREVVEKQYDMFKRCELTLQSLKELRKQCADRNLIFFSTPTNEKGVQDLVDLGAPLLKNGSDFLQNSSLIRAMARTHLPTVISTGMATLAEIEKAVKTFRQAGGVDLILLVCTSSYPTPPEETHLRRIPTLISATGCPVGFSDHTEGHAAALGAISLGACMIEKHFTVDKSMPGPDHWFSADPHDFSLLAKNVRLLEKELGNPEIRPTKSEIERRNEFRLSCLAGRNLKAGIELHESDITFGRPGTGVPPDRKDSLKGRKLRRALTAGQVIDPSDLL